MEPERRPAGGVQPPEVNLAIARGEYIYLPEGEKDAEELTAHGVTATTWTEGASKSDQKPKWRTEYTEQLAGAKVILIADKDKNGTGMANSRYIAEQLKDVATTVRIVQAKTGKDAYDHFAAGHIIQEFVAIADTAEGDGHRRLVVTRASDIKPRRVKWLEDERLAIGTLALLAGREGLGKSTLAYERCARITRGELQGEYHGQPKSVMVCATEDAWEETIVPRLMAHNADLNRVLRVEVLVDDIHTGLSLPKDLHAVEQIAAQEDAAVLLLDPLMSRIDEKLDTHRDAEVRRALEPMAALAQRAKLAVLGIMHHNKSGSNDPLQLVMGSKAFTAVARSVHTVIPHPDDETLRMFGTPKNNLGRTDLPTLVFTMASHPIDTDDGTAWVGRIKWQGTSDTSITEAMEQAANADDSTATGEAKNWLEDYLESNGGIAESKLIKNAGKAAGHAESAIHRARKKLKLEMSSSGFPAPHGGRCLALRWSTTAV